MEASFWENLTLGPQKRRLMFSGLHAVDVVFLLGSVGCKYHVSFPLHKPKTYSYEQMYCLFLQNTY